MLSTFQTASGFYNIPDCFCGHRRCTRRGFQEQGATWPLDEPRPARDLIRWTDMTSEEPNQFLYLLRRQRLGRRFNLEELAHISYLLSPLCDLQPSGFEIPVPVGEAPEAFAQGNPGFKARS